MNNIDKENIWNKVLEKTDLVSVISEFVALSKKGKNYVANCPFHGEATPSFYVNAEKRVWKCFGCNKAGNALKFLEYHLHISPLEALKKLAEKANIDLSKHDSFFTNSENNTELKKLYEINKAVNEYFQYQMMMKKTPELDAFIKKRNLTREIIKEFEIGFASSNESLYNYLISQKFDNYTIANASLINSNQGNFFSNRLMFPIKNTYGDIVGFSGRDITSKSDPKYLNTAETLAFHKSEVIFNYYHAQSEILKTNEVYLVEGQFDAVALYKINYKNVVAIMGTSLTLDHLKLFKNCKINMFFDSDKAGIAATKKHLKTILYFKNQFSIEPVFIINNLNKDPDELYNLDNGITLKKVIENKIDLFTFLFKNFETLKNNNSISTVEKNKEYSYLFEYIYYLDAELQLLLKEKVINSNIMSKEVYESFYSNYAKPNFALDKSFIKKVNSQRNFIKEEIEAPNNFNINKNTEINNYFVNDFEIPNPKRKIKSNKQFFARSQLIVEIIKTVLVNPSYIDDISKFSTSFIRSNVTKETEEYRELVLYALKLMKNNIYIENNLEQTISDDKNLSQERKERLLKAYDNLKDIQTLDKITFQNQSNILFEDKSNPKNIFNLKRGQNGQ
ncbi:DNA primase [Mycoplasma struthionis]|uniref:DNA primase n=1 Tax=Mycoplasma struthionis TaxID=538220 RepID=A0A502M267_9MOLU|nr:DNA primase [Mycoplasma struthionis]TPI01509.1 DNA primase [Mycoplasma struthionis]